MTNMQCYSYAVIAIDGLLKTKAKITTESLYYELYYLWDRYTPEEAEEVAIEKEENGEIL